ncbi:LodA/GoxA family CTQ-dependent oxidase [Variovorax sp. J22R24]|uniref:LodA/GoxA family CTQ-dependent oxidase n=1 Tax=Variovorax gracilis TaxID=3053502 RepID=UPI002576EF63|nr:LodA/GoxA family CTQ-dependent oxidase [Variovorax sp. J22R24]MDM0105523.1 LodA/GoxA family CTQ-dependent oxidase [Variovorax sp. J22R24]
MATTYRIHPAIGIARVGNSDEFFIGPERIGERPDPSGGFKDSQCRVKRQAARFRIFAHHDDGSFSEVTDAEAAITWTVHLANRKAAYPGRGNDPSGDLVIDPGPRSTHGPNQLQHFDTGTIRFAGESTTAVALGEIRSDTQNRLLVLAGSGRSASPGGNAIVSFWGNVGWFDDIGDGPVSASITLNADGSTPSVTGAWVITAPPKFAPHQDTPTTLWDRLFQAMATAGLVTEPTTTSYTRDVQPFLQRARDIRWVYPVGASKHAWADPVIAPAIRTAVLSRVRPNGNMPALAGSDPGPTEIQLAHLERWEAGTFINDWGVAPVVEPNLTPDGLDRAALEACVGGSFFPGIEAGGRDPANRPILFPTNYVAAFRVDHGSVLPGTMSASMALPWQADFKDCAGSWWPVPRPSMVTPEGTSTAQDWARGVTNYEEMVDNWHKLGFVVEQGAQHVEVERCDTPSITLMTPHLDFIDVPQGPMGMVREQPLAITFEVSAPSASVTFDYAPGGALSHPQLLPGNASVTVGPTGGVGIATAQLWVIYRTGAAPSSIPTQTVTVQATSGQTWSITIDANTIARKTAAVALVLDRSGSMADDRGDGQTKHASLQQAAEIFVDVMLEGDGVGLVRYDSDAQVVQPVKMLGAGGIGDTNRSDTIDLIRGNSFDPAGATSIGDGIFEGRQILDGAGSFDVKALAVLTDGIENQPRWIADVAPQINEYTYAIGLGTPQNTSAAALQNISGNNGGFLLITGSIGQQNRFLLQKYFLQILAGVSNAEVVLDPDGDIAPGQVQRIPFQLTDADAGVDVILLSPFAELLDFRLQAPSGRIIEPWRAMSEPTMRWVLGRGVAYYRLVLPTQLLQMRFDQAGTWHALLTIGRPRTRPTEGREDGIDLAPLRGLHADARQRPRPVRPAALPNEQLRSFEVARDYERNAPGGAMPGLAAAGAVGTEQRRTLPYSLVVHSYSDISLRAEAHQSNWEPGATVRLAATLTQSAVPLQTPGSVWAEITRPDGSRSQVALQMTEPGRFAAEFRADSAGVYRLRVRAHGRTRSGQAFSRERTLTVAVWRGGDRDAEDSTRPPGMGTHHGLCDWVECVLKEGGVISPELEKRLLDAGVDLRKLRKCMAQACRDTTPPADR